jgi:hypothetical protein
MSDAAHYSTQQGRYIGDELNAWLEALGVDCSELVRRTGIQDIPIMRRNGIRAGEKRLVRITAALGISEHEFFRGPDKDMLAGEMWVSRDRIGRVMQSWCKGCDAPRNQCGACVGFNIHCAMTAVLTGRSIEETVRETRMRYERSVDEIGTLYDYSTTIPERHHG